MLLDATQWSHLPVAGGWYNQHPLFIDELMMIFDEKAKSERAKRARENPGQNQADPQAMARQAAMNAGVPYIH